MNAPQTKFCCSKECSRAGEARPLTDFPVSRARKDGLYPQCKLCARRSTANYRLRRKRCQQKSLTPAERVCRILQAGPLEFGPLARAAKLSFNELSDLLPYIHGRERFMPILSRNGTGPRVYFLKPELPANVKPGPPLSFSTLSFLHPVVGDTRTSKSMEVDSDDIN